MFSLECSESPSRNEHFIVSASILPTVVFPDPATPMSTMIIDNPDCSSEQVLVRPDLSSGGRCSKNKSLHRQRETLFHIGGRHKRGRALHVHAGVPHGNAHPAPLEHEHIVRHVPNGRD